MLGLTTGNNSVDEIGKIHLEGNIIPHMWYQNITLPSGKPDLVSIILLAEIVYWYRPTYIRNEETGALVGMKKRFASDLLQRSYDSFSEQFGISKRQAQDAMKRLEDAGLVKRVLRNVIVKGQAVNNVLFIDVFPETLKSITFGDTYHVQTGEGSRLNGGGNTFNRETNTEITTKITTENTIKEKPSRTRKTRVYEADSAEYKLADCFVKLIRKNNEAFKEPDLQTWSDTIRLMLEIDKRTPKEIQDLMVFVQKDDFEMTNVLSPKKLRARYDQLFMKMQQRAKNGGKRRNEVYTRRVERASNLPADLEF